jgi:type IV pilus assembly protein PilC
MASASITFIYKGTDRKGHKVEGEVKSTSSALAKAHLIKQGVRAKTVRRKPKSLFGGKGKPIKPLDIALFTRQMSTMMKAGVPLVQSFEIVAGGSEKKSLAILINLIREDVAAGGSFANALRKHPKYFDELFCNLVDSGEQSGALETMLERIATYKEKTEILKAKIKKAMTYPIAVMVVAIAVSAILLIFVVPQFAETFGSFGAELPAFTQAVLSLSEFMQEYWFIALTGLVVAIIAYSQAKQRSKAFRIFLDALTLKIPIIKVIVFNSIIARYARTLSTTFAAGVPLIDALESVAGSCGNHAYEMAVLRIRDEVSTGTQLNVAMKATNVFPAMIVQMTMIGEESGALDSMLSKSADYYEDIVDNLVDNLTALLEPFIMVILGVLVGSMLIAMYLPIFQMGNAV